MRDPRDELTESYYFNSDAAYSEQLRPPLNISIVFECAIEKQLVVRTLQADPSESSLQTIASLVDLETKELDEMAERDDLMLKPVTMTGLSVLLPASRSLFETKNASMIYTLDEGAAVDDLKLSHEVQGEFYGFGVRFDAVPEGDTIGGVKPILIYQVKIGGFKGPHAIGHVFAIGDVGEAQIEFHEDVMKQKIMNILTILMRYDHPDVQRCINSINMRLSKSEPYTAGDIRYIGHKCNVILAVLRSRPDNKYVEALAELMDAYVDFGTITQTVADEMITIKKNEAGELTRDAYHVPGYPLVSITGKILELKAMPNYKTENGEIAWESKQTMYAVLHAQNEAYFIRLTDVENFKLP